MTTLKDVLQKAGYELSPEEESAEKDAMEERQRIKQVLERPDHEVQLMSVYAKPEVTRKIDKDPTPDLVIVPVGMSYETACRWFEKNLDNPAQENGPFLITCKDTEQAWYAKDRRILDMNFIYREDLCIEYLKSLEYAVTRYMNTAAEYNPDIKRRLSCYILDAPANETYEVYYDTTYPSRMYGKATPIGMFVHKYENRFHRDMAILELDNLYSNNSSKKAGKLTKKELRPEEAIVVSDGAWINSSCSASYVYLDATTLQKMTIGFLPSEPTQAVLISEIVGAHKALQMCYLNKKTSVTYYYDNTSIMNVFRNRKTEYIREVVEYKQLLETMNSEGYSVTFVELHPKTGNARDAENKALMFFHNQCDISCRAMADIFQRDYKDIASMNTPSGKSYKQMKADFGKQRKPTNNSANGNNRYGRRF